MAVPTAPTAAFQIQLRVRLRNVPGVLGALASAIGDAGGNIAVVEGFEAKGASLERSICVNARDEDHQKRIVAAVESLENVELLDWFDRTFRMHEAGKIETLALCSVGDRDDLSMAYTPGVARVCMAIHEDVSKSYKYTIRKNTVAIVSDGTAVLGLGNIGPEAAMPVMEGKALLFKEFAGVDAFPLCLNTTDIEEIIETVERIAPSFGGINLEDIAAPACFEIEQRLKESLDIPVFHDDQHGTAVVALAALWNSLKIVDKNMSDISVVISGIGAAGVAIGKILLSAGVGEVIGVDSTGAIYQGRDRLNPVKEWFAANTNRDRRVGSLQDVIVGADVFMGVSAPDVLTAADLRGMAADPIIFAMANPNPEITPEAADGLAAVMATGRSDYPNQINNVLAFPGIFRGALDVGATDITESMKLAAAENIASVVGDDLAPDHIIPSVFDPRVLQAVAPAVSAAAIADGVIRA
jgi:malate dehydrogenase (oxaloacetate-decarboxylating)|tara:strand:- start:361 stop:1767 length:1407 start_codon:yes stop_codon:yes gene_type:complete